MMDIHYAETKYGFEFGAAKVERFEKLNAGQVVVTITTPRTVNDGYQIYVTRTGKVRVFTDLGLELFPRTNTEGVDDGL